MSSICVDSFMLENGERYCHVVNKKTGEPLYYPKECGYERCLQLAVYKRIFLALFKGWIT